MREREHREERQVCEPEGGKMATPGLASRSGNARERRWRPFDQTQDKLFSKFPFMRDEEKITYLTFYGF